MAGKPKRMSLVKQILRMHNLGKGYKSIARSLSISKNTVKSYISRVLISGIPISELLLLEDPELEKSLLSGNPAYKDARYEPIKERLVYYNKELTRVGVTRITLWEEYKSDFPLAHYSYSQFCALLRQYQFSSKPSLVFWNILLEINYILILQVRSYPTLHRDTGEEIYVQVFVACLPTQTIVLQWQFLVKKYQILYGHYKAVYSI